MNKKKDFSKVTRSQLPTCWLNVGEDYEYIAKGGITVTKRNLPVVNAKYSKLLDTMGIPYERGTQPCKENPEFQYPVCIFWDPELFETEEKKLPLYTQYSTNAEGEELFIYAGQKISFDIPTRETLQKAYQMAKIVNDRIKKYNQTKDLENCYEYAKVTLGESDVAIGRLKLDEEVADLEKGEDHIKFLQVYNSEDEPTGYYGIFDMRKLDGKKCVVVSVPKKIAGLVVGKGGKNKKKWEEKLGDERIVVVDSI